MQSRYKYEIIIIDAKDTATYPGRRSIKNTTNFSMIINFMCDEL